MPGAAGCEQPAQCCRRGPSATKPGPAPAPVLLSTCAFNSSSSHRPQDAGGDSGAVGQAVGRAARDAVLTSWAVLLHAALPRLQQRGAGGSFLPGGPRHLPHPRLHSPLAAAGPALVGAGAPLAPGARLARFCGGQGHRTGTVATQHRASPQGPRGWGASAPYLGTRGCRAAPRCWGGTAESTGPCAGRTCPCTSCRSLC